MDTTFVFGSLPSAVEKKTDMQLREVTDSASDKAFHQVPYLLYAGDTNWIPHLRQDVAKVFDKEANKAFRDGECIRWILEDNSGRTIGRVAAFYSNKYIKQEKNKVGGVGFFECVDDDKAAKMLLDKAVEWLKGKGMTGVDGPINFGEKDAFWGLLIENFTDMNSYRMNYNPPYYQKFFEQYGFQLYYRQLCYKRSIDEPAQPVFVRKAEKAMQDPLLKITNARHMSIDKIAENFLEVYNGAWAGHMGFQKMALAQAKVIMKSMKPVMDKDVMLFAFHDSKPVAFYINMPELNEIFRHVRGNLNWWGKLKFLYYFRFGKRQTMVGMLFGVKREYQGRGIEGAIIKWAERNIVPLKRYSETILTWVGDFNPKMVHLCEGLGSHLYRTLVTYRMWFDPERKFERHPMMGMKEEPAEKE